MFYPCHEDGLTGEKHGSHFSSFSVYPGELIVFCLTAFLGVYSSFVFKQARDKPYHYISKKLQTKKHLILKSPLFSNSSISGIMHHTWKICISVCTYNMTPTLCWVLKMEILVVYFLREEMRSYFLLITFAAVWSNVLKISINENYGSWKQYIALIVTFMF